MRLLLPGTAQTGWQAERWWCCTWRSWCSYSGGWWEENIGWIFKLNLIFSDRQRCWGETLPRSETSHCTLCRWLWPVSALLQKHKQSVSRAEWAQHLKPPCLSSAKTERSSLKSSIIGNIHPGVQSDGGNSAWYVCVLQLRTQWSECLPPSCLKWLMGQSQLTCR